MKINVHVKEKSFGIQCGEGVQRILWLAHAAMARYDSNFGLELGVPKGLQTDEGNMLDDHAIISSTLEDDQHVWVLLKDDEPTSRLPTKE
mmetsp:Transcript_10324/g.15095  ORF Transcript_10324/g.15095 Transcript_10324/m.15095 type:complete len:90 (-) Transcript_10324:41-310(-)